MKITTIIVAGGSGSRMGTETPKQFLLLGGLPVLMRTIAAMRDNVNNYVNNFIVVLPQTQIEHWKELCAKYKFDIDHQIVAGGDTRFASVLNGLSKVQDADLVLIHDGVRPLVDREMVVKVVESATRYGAAIPVVKINDSLRKIVDNSSIIIDRRDYRAVQTPQGFTKEVITKAYYQTFDPVYTDDASVVESAGFKITLTEGNSRNLKITTPSDLELAEFFITRCEQKY